LVSSRKPPEKLVVMGRITAPFGIKGWVKVRPLTAAAENILAYPRWWVGRGAGWQEYEVAESSVQSPKAVVARLAGCEERDAAAQFRGSEIAVPRSQLPPPPPGEYYWADLLGLSVVNGESQQLGRIVRILETGANDVLVVHGDRERLIPFIGEVIREVDAGAGVIRVSWGADY
jgi:16S rRNA processing protein RimM